MRKIEDPVLAEIWAAIKRIGPAEIARRSGIGANNMKAHFAGQKGRPANPCWLTLQRIMKVTGQTFVLTHVEAEK